MKFQTFRMKERLDIKPRVLHVKFDSKMNAAFAKTKIRNRPLSTF